MYHANQLYTGKLQIRHHNRLHFDKRIFVNSQRQKIQDHIFDHI